MRCFNIALTREHRDGVMQIKSHYLRVTGEMRKIETQTNRL